MCKKIILDNAAP